MSSLKTLRPQKTVPLASGDLIARDLPWQESLEFLRLLSGHAKELLAAVNAPGNEGKTNETLLAQLLPKLTELITNAGGLSMFLLTKSTGKDAAWFAENLGTLETLEVLDAALEVNLSDELIALGKKVGGRLARVMPAGKTTSTTPPSATS